MTNEDNAENPKTRSIARKLARELQPDELDAVGGGCITFSGCLARGIDDCDVQQF